MNILYPIQKFEPIAWLALMVAVLAGCGGGESSETPSLSEASATAPSVKSLAAKADAPMLAAVAPTYWTWVATEGQSFTVPPATVVRYGFGNSWVQRRINGTAQCSDATFRRDPAATALKTCQVLAVATPEPTGVLLGTGALQGGTDSNPAGMAEAFLTTAAVSGSADTLRLWIEGTSTATRVVAGIYSDAGGRPGALLASGTLSSPVAGAWNPITIPAVTVTAGAAYWVALLTPAGSGTLIFRDVASGGGLTVTTSQTSLTTLPTTWTTGSTYANSPASVYLSASVVPPPPPPLPTDLLLGTNAIQASIDTNPAGMAEAYLYTAVATGMADTLRIYLDSTNTATSMVAGVYADSAGRPGTLLASGSLSTLTAGGWNAVSVPSFGITAGNRYWLAVLAPVGAGELRVRNVGTGGTSTMTSGQTTLSAMPSSWTVGNIFTSGPASAYITAATIVPPPPGADDPIPASRRTDWTHAGLVGGIPNRTQICATFSPGATSAAINTAIAACTNGVVQLSAGTYNLSGIRVNANNVTLRGAGADQTILKGCNPVNLGAGTNTASNITITGGGQKDTSMLTVSSTAGLFVGQMIEIDRDDDPSIVVITGDTTTRHMRQVNSIEAINGNTLSLRNLMAWDFSSGNPRIKFTFTNTRNSGIEDLKIDHTGTSGCTPFKLEYCDSCWIKGVHSEKPSGYHMIILASLNGEIRDSFINDASSYGANNGGLVFYGSNTYGSNSNWKIENNIFNKTFPAITFQFSATGFFTGYNFAFGSGSQPADMPATWTFSENHGAHDMMNLWEGNVGELYGSDGYYGSSSHGTLFRNHILGYNRISGKFDEPVRLNRLSYYFNLVGNVLGASVWQPSLYQQNTDGCTAGAAIYRLGYPNIGNCSFTDVTGYPVPGGMTYPEAKVGTTLFRWGNYDYFHKTTRWLASEVPADMTLPATQTLRASYFYSSRPGWFPAGVPWPPIGPDVTGGNAFGDTSGHVSKIPAQLCWDLRGLETGGSFRAAACYPSN